MRADYLKLMADGVIATVKEYVSKANAALIGRMDLLEKQISAIPGGPQGERGIEGVAGRDGVDGKSVTVEEIRPLVIQEVAAAVKAIPAPKDGASVSLDDMRPVIASGIQEAIKALPIPKDGAPGKDADPAEVVRLIKAAVDAIPKPQDGTSVTVDDVAPMIGQEVGKAIAALPAAKDGKDGCDGASMRVGDGPPLFDGKSGDVYLDSKTGDIYKCA